MRKRSSSNQEVGSGGPTTQVYFIALRVAPAVRGDWRTTLEKRMAKPTQPDAEAAVRVLIEWAGDDPNREGLIDTPGRVARSYRELFAGYAAEPRDYLKRTFEEVGDRKS